mmetsp:Transcript_23985/g.76002  ORF Transcript_23985/g.76002 Transcript_23985/m.76002 type:complete len:308 (-) Transcript_23985:163-1086(-)
MRATFGGCSAAETAAEPLGWGGHCRSSCLLSCSARCNWSSRCMSRSLCACSSFERCLCRFRCCSSSCRCWCTSCSSRRRRSCSSAWSASFSSFNLAASFAAWSSCGLEIFEALRLASARGVPFRAASAWGPPGSALGLPDWDATRGFGSRFSQPCGGAGGSSGGPSGDACFRPHGMARPSGVPGSSMQGSSGGACAGEAQRCRFAARPLPEPPRSQGHLAASPEEILLRGSGSTMRLQSRRASSEKRRLAAPKLKKPLKASLFLKSSSPFINMRSSSTPLSVMKGCLPANMTMYIETPAAQTSTGKL